MEKMEIFEKYINNQMNDSELASFYSSLGENSSLRADFATYKSISTSIKSVGEQFAPKPEQKSRIFEKAGFALPNQGANVSIHESKSFKNHRNYYLSAAAGSIITIILFLSFNFLTNNGLNVKSNNISENSKNQNESIFEKSSNSNSQIEVNNNHAKTSIDKEQKTQKAKNSFNTINIENDNTLANNMVEDSQKNINKIEPSLYNSFGTNRINNHGKLFNINTLQTTNSIERIFSDKDIIIELKNCFSKNLSNEEVYPKNVSPFNNLDIALYYSLSNEVRIGAEVKQETFLADYTRTESNDRYYRYVNQPNFTTFSIVTRWLPIEISSFKPYIQIGFGANSGGFTAKPEIGIEYKISDKLAIISSFEYTHFWFSHGSNWFNTKKIGVSYGLSYSF